MNRRAFLAGSAALASQTRWLRSLPQSSSSSTHLSTPHDLLSTTYSASFLKAKLLAANEWHPFPKYAERAQWTAVPADLQTAIIAKAESDQKAGWQVEPATMFLEFKRTGNQADWQSANWGRRAQMQRLLLAELFEGKGRFIEDIANGIWLICEETTWSDNAHMYMQHAGVGLADVTEPVVDLFAAETAATLAWTRYLIGEQLDQVSPLIGRRIILECQRRILEPARDRNDFFWMGLEQTAASTSVHNASGAKDMGSVPSFGPTAHQHRLNNWTPWINSNLLVTNLLLEENAETRLHELTRITRSVDAYLNQYWPDAGEEEGPTYYTRSPLCLFECLNWLESATGNATQVFDHPFIAAMGRYILNAHIARDCYINYGDADMHLHPEGELIYRYGKRVHDEQLAAFGAYCASGGGWTAKGDALTPSLHSELVSLSRVMPALLLANEIRATRPNEGLVRDTWYPSLGLMTARRKADTTAGMYVAVLAANNGRSHSHNDTGSYIIFSNGEPVIIDPGVETYSAKTFSPDRYKIWTMQSAFHNLPTAGSVMQHDGAQFRATDHHYESNDDKAVFSFNLASAYPSEAGIQRWTRTVTLDRATNKVVVQEDFELARAVPVTLSFMTPRLAHVEPDGRLTLTLSSNESNPASLRFDTTKLQSSVEVIPLADPRIRADLGNQIYRILLSSKELAATGTWTYEIGDAWIHK